MRNANNSQLSRSGRSSWALARARFCGERGAAGPRGGTRAAGSARRRRPLRAGPGLLRTGPGLRGPGEKPSYGRRPKQRRPVLVTPPSPWFGAFWVSFSCPPPFSSCSTEMKSCQGNLPAESHARTGPLGAWSTLLGPKHIDNSA